MIFAISPVNVRTSLSPLPPPALEALRWLSIAYPGPRAVAVCQLLVYLLSMRRVTDS